MKRLVTIKTFTSYNELAIVCNKLEQEGIETFTDEDIAEQDGDDNLSEAGYIELKVNYYDEKLALLILSEMSGGNSNPPELSGFWKRFLIFHYSLPLFNRINPIYNFLIMVTAILTGAFCIIYWIIKPTTEEMLTSTIWCFDHMVYQDTRYSAHTVYYGADSLLKGFKMVSCDDEMLFYHNHTVTLPGFKSAKISGSWYVEGDYVVFTNLSAFNHVLERSYLVKEIKHGLMLTSDSTVIVLRHPPEVAIPWRPDLNRPPSPYGQRWYN